MTKFSWSFCSKFSYVTGKRLRSEFAVSARFAAGLDSGDFEGDYVVTEESYDPADGADEARASFTRPIHGFGEGRFEN